MKRKIQDITIANQFLLFINPLLKTEADYVEIDQQEFDEE